MVDLRSCSGSREKGTPSLHLVSINAKNAAGLGDTSEHLILPITQIA